MAKVICGTLNVQPDGRVTALHLDGQTRFVGRIEWLDRQVLSPRLRSEVESLRSRWSDRDRRAVLTHEGD